MTDRDVAALLAVQEASYARAGPGLKSSWPEARSLGHAALRALVEDVVYGVLATARPDGRAHAAPVAFSLEEGSFWVATVAGRRLANVRATPWASLVAFDGQRDGAHRALTAEGPIELHEDADFEAARERLDEAWAARHGKAPDWAVAFVELRPERVFSHASGDA
jgi:nitroimidazol reductase NimA-like FMN-containing flavoprotein (pyridoxamine 5'-phosphate oxidase superfamily)